MTHHWITYNGIILDFSKGTLKEFVDWDDIYDPIDPYEVEYKEFKFKNECHFLELFEIKKKKLEDKYLSELINVLDGDKKRAIEYFNGFYNIIYNLDKYGGYIYRVVFSPELKIFYSDLIGSNWSHSKEELNKIIPNITDKENIFIVTAKTKPNNIDLDKTLKSFCSSPYFEEIFVKNKNNIDFIGVEKISNVVSIYEKKSNIKNISYQAVVKNEKSEPILYVTDYIIVRSFVDKVECKIRGYKYTSILVDGEIKNGWFEVDDFNTDKTHIIFKKDFKNGNVRMKIYNIII